MSDYIKREDVLNGLDKLCDIVCPYSKKQRSVMCGACTLGSAFDAIEEMTAAEVVERKTGKWIFKKPPDDWIMSLYMCDQCHHWEEGKPNYCPNCGTRMVTDDA